MLQLAGLEMPGYNQFLMNLKEQLPIIGVGAVCDKDGNWYANDCLLYTSVPRQSSRQESRLWSMIVTNMQALRQSLLPRECWTPPVYAIINIREPDARFR